MSVADRFEKRVAELLKTRAPNPPTAHAIFEEASYAEWYRGYTKGVADALEVVAETLKEIKHG